MKALAKAMRLIRLPRATGGGTDDADPALMQDAIDTAPEEVPTSPQFFNYRGASIPLRQDPGFVAARGSAPSEPISYQTDEYGNVHAVPAGTAGARVAPAGYSLGSDGQFYNERAPVGLVGKLLGQFGWNNNPVGVGSKSARAEQPQTEAWDTPGGARANTTWAEAAQNTAAGLNPQLLAESLRRTGESGVVGPQLIQAAGGMENESPAVANLALETTANTGFLGSQFAEAGSAGIFGGRLAKTADHAKLAQAEQMAEMGAHPNDIYATTGWFQGPDKKWRFEINDYKSKFAAPELSDFNTVNVGPLGEALIHPELYKAYPELAERPYLAGALPLPQGTVAAHAPEHGLYMINKPELARAQTDPRSALLHEVQHGVQQIEGFSPGTSAKQLQEGEGKALPQQVFDERAQAVQERYREAQRAYQAEPTIQNQVEMLEAEKAIKLLPSSPTPKDTFFAYHRTAGEAEARNVQNRMNMTGGQRQVSTPWETQDVPNERQFITPPNAPLENPMTPKDVMSLFANGDERSSAALAALSRAEQNNLPMDEATRMARAQQQGYNLDQPLYHGTTQDIGPAFKDPRDPVNWAQNFGPGYSRESFHGPSVYTTTSPSDARSSYGFAGPDLASRIGNRADFLEQQGLSPDEATRTAQSELEGGNEQVHKLVSRFENPLYVNVPREPSRWGNQPKQLPRAPVKSTFFDYDSGYNPETDEYGTPTGSGIQLLGAVEKALKDSGVAKNDQLKFMGDLEGEMMNGNGISASEFERMIRGNDRLYDLMYDSQKYPGGAGEFLQDVYRNLGYDSVHHQNADVTFNTLSGRMPSGTTHVSTWEPEKLRSIDAAFDPNRRHENGLYYANADNKSTAALGALARGREIDQHGFYSPSLEASKAIPQQTGTVAQMRSMLLNNGAKPKELEAVGFDRAFPDPNAKVSRQQIEDYLRQNRVTLGQDRLGGVKDQPEWGVRPRVLSNGQKTSDFETYNLATGEGTGNWGDKSWADNILKTLNSNAPGRFEQYSTPGGIPGSYREQITTLPNKFKNTLENANISTPDAVYTTSHWPGVTNPIAHRRTKQFRNPDNSITQLEDEWQSDPGERARDEGIRDPAKIEALSGQLADARQRLQQAMANVPSYEEIQKWREPAETENVRQGASINNRIMRNSAPANEVLGFIGRNHPDPEIRAKATALAAPVDAAINSINDLSSKLDAAQKGVPNLPFIKNTSDWTDLLAKQALIDAAKNPDVNRLAWAPGQVQAKRYGLEHHVDSIDVKPPLAHNAMSGNAARAGVGKITVKMKTGQWLPFEYDEAGKITSAGAGRDATGEAVGKNLSELVGPEVAQRILAKKDIGTLRGLDLAIGGEGMHGYYGNEQGLTPEGRLGIAPQRLQKIVKGLDPEAARVESAIIQKLGDAAQGKTTQYPSMPFTPAMREKILKEGLSLFNKGDPYASAILAAISRGEEGQVGRDVARAGNQEAAGLGAAEAGAPGRGELPGGPGGVQAPGRAADPYARIPGIPETTKIPGHGTVEARPIPWVVDAANAYSKKAGIEHQLPEAFAPLDRERAKRIADAFEAMKHDPTNPEVRRAYEAMADETLAQYKALKDQGARYYFNNGTDPYAASPAMGFPELRDKRSLSIFPTEQGFGTGAEAAAAIENNPLLKRTGEKFGDKEATVNDLFRAVHDSFGHFGFGNPFFRAPGEERAWMLHSGMYGPEARKAMTSETRGQNSWLNSGPHAAHNATASGADTVYAQQKTGLLPDWVVNEGANGITRQQYDAIQKAMRLGGKRLFSNADEQLSLPLSQLAREGAEQEGSVPAQTAKEPKPQKPIEPRDLDPNDEGFYSQQVEAMKTIPMKSGNADQWRNALKKAGVKDEEMKWTGMNDWLKSQGNAKIPREDVQKYAEENKVIPHTESYTGGSGDDGYSEEQVWDRAREVHYDQELESAHERLSVDLDPEYIDKFKNDHSIEEDTSQGDMFGGKKTFVIRDGSTKNNDVVAHGFESEKDAENHLEKMARQSAEDNDKWAVLDDGDHHSSYDSEREAERAKDNIAESWASDSDPSDVGHIRDWREWLDMPEPEDEESRTIGYLDRRPKGGENYTERVMETPRKAAMRGGKGYNDTHIDWPQDNIPGWLLTEDYRDQLTGKPVLMAHEKQSDWAQAGANEGFTGKHTADEISAAAKAFYDAHDAAEIARSDQPLHFSSLGENDPSRGYYQASPDQRHQIYQLERNLSDANWNVRHEADQVRRRSDRLVGLEKDDPDYDHWTEMLKEAQNDLQNATQRRDLLEQKMRDYVSAIPRVSNEEALPKINHYNELQLKANELERNYRQMQSGISPGPWVNDVPEVTKLLTKRGLIDAAKEGKDYYAWSSPEMIRARWGNHDYIDPVYGKTIPNVALKLAREHDPEAKLTSVQLGNKSVEKPTGSFDVAGDLDDAKQFDFDYGLFSRAPYVHSEGTSSAPITDIAYGPSQRMRHDSNVGRYHLITQAPGGGPRTTGYEFATREAAEEAMRQINDQIAKGMEEQAKKPKGNAQAIEITPRMRESILKRGFSAFMRQDPTVAAALSAGAQGQENDDLPDYIEPAAKKRIRNR